MLGASSSPRTSCAFLRALGILNTLFLAGTHNYDALPSSAGGAEHVDLLRYSELSERVEGRLLILQARVR